MLDIKILGYRTDQTFAIRRVVVAALDELRKEQPGIKDVVTNIKEAQDILQYTQGLMAPGLVVNGKLVYLCLGRIRTRIKSSAGCVMRSICRRDEHHDNACGDGA
jgi:hypothetical protein